jgi:hypothetical protein
MLASLAWFVLFVLCLFLITNQIFKKKKISFRTQKFQDAGDFASESTDF